MSKKKNDKNKIANFDNMAAHVGLAACTLASIAVIAEAFEAPKQHKLANPMQPSFGHATEYAEHHGAGEMRKEEIRHMHVSYGAAMRSHPIAGTV